MDRILYIEDDKVDQMAFKRFASKEKIQFQYLITDSVNNAKAILETEKFDVIVTDFNLGDGTAFDIFEGEMNTPVILVTGAGDEQIAVEALKKGFYDYITKDRDGNYLKVLPVTISKATQRKQAEDELIMYRERLEDLVEARSAQLQKEISERQHVEKSLQETRQILSKAFELTPIGTVLVDLNGNYKKVNASFCEMLGYEEQEILSKTFRDLTHPDDHRISLDINQKLLSGEADKATFEKRYLHKNGNIIHVHTTTTFLKDEKNEPSCFFSQIEDITFRKEAEEALKISHVELEKIVEERTRDLQKAKEEAEAANQTKSEFLSNISHEIRTPMHQILSYSKFGVDKVEKVNRNKLLHYFTQIGTIGDRLMALLNDLLDLSKMEAGKVDYEMKENDLESIISTIMSEFNHLKNEKNISLIFKETNIPTKVFCDGYKIGQVIRNLLSNAIKFTPPHKAVIIKMASTVLKQDTAAEKDLNAISVSIHDEGVGIPESELDLIFDKFIQSSKTKTGAGGTGLGLSICYEIIMAHKGKILASNGPDGGSVFRFVLPYQRTE